jgi:S-(hydroxymethyl)glutathione dehydrogenase/alcohol dehydrogenase
MVKALVARAPETAPEVIDVVLPELGPGEVRVRMVAAGVCHSDLSMINGTMTPEFPLVLGHEGSGVVVETGSAVDDLETGAEVVLNWAAPCRDCWFCLNGEPWLCQVRADKGVSRQSGTLADGTPLHLGLGVGVFAEETVVPRNLVMPVPEGIAMDAAALIGCAVMTGFGAVRNTAGVRSGESVVVFGLGGIGLSAIAGARVAGASRVIAVDVSAAKETAAKEVGATDFFLYDEKIARQVRGVTEGRGADHAIECVGKAATIRAAWSSTRRGGTCTVTGIGRVSESASFNAMEIYHFARSLTGSVFGSSDPSRDLPLLAGFVSSGDLDLEPMISHRTDLEGAIAAFERMSAGEGLRTLIEFA